jgi:hypothetical protein
MQILDWLGISPKPRRVSEMTSEPSTDRASVERLAKKAERPSSVTPKKSTSPEFMSGRLAQFDAVMDGCRDLFEEKNSQYKDSISRTGVLGSVVAIAGLSARLEGLVLSAADAGESNEEAVVDVVKDIINYGVITGIMIMDTNWKP